jgi:hypothetical protein
VNGYPSAVATRQFFPFHAVKRLSRLMEISVLRFVPVKFFAFRTIDFGCFFFPHNLNTAIKLTRIQLIYSWLFYSVGSITKK